MSDESQILIPRSFIDLFVPPGKHKPTETRAVIAERHELCEDLAQMLVETAQAQRWSLGITTADVLQKIAAGLAAMDLALSEAERGWVLTRLAELLADQRPGN
jgi:hypothetical protein